MNDSEINDVRLQKEFKGATFSKFQKQKVKQQLIANIYNCKIEGAWYWSA